MALQAILAEYNHIWLLIVLIVLIYGALKTIKLPGSDWVLALTSVLLSVIVFSSTRATNYMVKVIPLLTIIFFLIFIILITISLSALSLDTFKKPLAWIGFILAILIILSLAFNSFPTLNHLFPGSSDSGLDKNMREFKDFIYSYNFREFFIFIVSIVAVCFFLFKK